jgi:tetratricopeptide (TPR) repeat protein
MIKAGRDATAERRFLDAWRILAAVPPGSAEREEAVRRLDRVGRFLLHDMRAAYKERRFRAVVRDGSAAAEILPDSPEVHKLLARAAMRLRRYPVALEAWKRLRRLLPNPDDAVLMQIARCHLQLNDAAAGRAVVAEILARDPNHAEALQLQIDIRERLLLA